MNKQIIFFGAIAAFCVLALVVSAVGAATMTHPANGRHRDNSTCQGQKMSQEGMITALAAQGVDVSGLRTALQNGDKDAVKVWLAQYRETHVNGTADGNSRQIGTQTFIDRLAAQGVDVSGLRTALQNGDKDAAKAWFKEFRQTHKDMMAALGRDG